MTDEYLGTGKGQRLTSSGQARETEADLGTGEGQRQTSGQARDRGCPRDMRETEADLGTGERQRLTSGHVYRVIS